MEIYEYVKNTTLRLNEENGPMDEFTKSEIHQIYEDAKRALIRQKMNEVVKKRWANGEIYKKFKELYDKEMDNNKDNTQYIWMTINPRPDIELKDMIKTVEKYVKRTFIEKYVYVYEQRASKENNKNIGTGFHTHLLIKRNMETNIKTWDIKARTKTAFKNITDVNNNKIFNYHNCPEEYVKDKINYMINKNLDEDHKDKEQKQDMDKEWRKLNKLKEIYDPFKMTEKNITEDKCQENPKERKCESINPVSP